MTSIDIIGTIYTDDEETVALTGWHVNITTDGLAARPDLAPYVVTPSRLRRVWAGDDPVNPVATVALKFADEAEALTFLPAD